MIERSTPFSLTARALSFTLLATAVSGIVGCTSTQQRADEAPSDTAQSINTSNEWTIDHADWAELGFQWQWTGYPPMQPGATLDHASVYPDLLTFVGSGSTVSVLESNTGKVRWSRQLDRPTTRFVEPVRRDGILYTASDTELWELDLRNGNTLDRDSLGTLVNTSPLLVNNLAIFGTLAGELFAYQMDNDFKLWSYKFDGPIHQPAIRVSDEYIAALSEKGDLRTLQAINAHSGMNAHIAGGSDATLLTDGVGIYVASLDQSLYAFDINDGFRFWRIRSSDPITVQHTLIDNTILATTRDKGLMSVDASSGEILWNNDTIGGWVLTVVDDKELIVWSGYELLAVDKDRGDVIARMPLSNISGIRADSTSNGDIYVITLEGSVAKFTLK